MLIPKKVMKLVKRMQKSEITEYYVYTDIANKINKEKDKEIILKIAKHELEHYEFWSKILNTTTKPKRFKVWFYKLLTFLLGYTFTLKFMEKNENSSAHNYEILQTYFDGVNEISKIEHEHEHQLLHMLNEERLRYVGSMILGLNDALVELTGVIAGLTLAISDTRVISVSALITGIAASLSMASSEFLSAKADNKSNALKSATYTGVTYIITVIILVLPYLLISSRRFLSLGVMLFFVVLIIFVFNCYVAVAKSESFKKRFLQMITISLSVAAISFLIGLLVKTLFGLDV